MSEDIRLHILEPNENSALLNTAPEAVGTHPEEEVEPTQAEALDLEEPSFEVGSEEWLEHGVHGAFMYGRLHDVRLHEAVEERDLGALRRLLAGGAAMDAIDRHGSTAMCLCVYDRLLEPFKILLEAGCANVVDGDGNPLLAAVFLFEWAEGAAAALEAGADLTATCANGDTTIHYLIRKHKDMRDKELFEKILDIVKNKGLLDCLSENGVTPLYVAIEEDDLEAVKALLRRRANMDKVSIRNDSVLHVAANRPRILKHLLENHSHVRDEHTLKLSVGMYNSNGYTPIQLAVRCKQLLSFRLLNETDCVLLFDKTATDRKNCLHLAVENECLEIADAIFRICTGYLKHRITSEKDENGNTPFHAALQGKSKDLVELFLSNGAVLSDKGKDETSALEIIATKFHDAPDIFNKRLDDSITTISGETMIDYSLLTDNQDASQINVIEEFVEHGQSDVLLHPLIKSFVSIKWNYFLPLFYVMIAVHAVFLLTFNVLVANIFYYRDQTNVTDAANQTGAAAATWAQPRDWRYWVLIVLMYTMIILLIAQEGFFIYIKRLQWRLHFADWEVWMRLGFLALAMFLPLVLARAAPADWQRHAACAALLLGWLQAMFLLSRVPGWGSYVLMFGTVAFNLLKILASMVFLIIGFSFCFMIQYRSKPPFDGPAAAFFKTLVMMSSEFEYEGLFGIEHSDQLRDTIVIVRLLFLLFLIFVAIALMNFMTGAAVTDINELNVMAEVRTLEKQVQLLGTIEAIVYEGALAKMFAKLFSRGRYYEKTTYSTTKVTKWNVVTANEVKKDEAKIESIHEYFEKLYKYLNERTTGPRCYGLPVMYTNDIPLILENKITFEVAPCDKLNRDIVKIARKKERREEKTNMNTAKNKIEELHDAFLEKPKEGEGKGNKDWVLEMITKQDEKIKSLTDDLQRVSQHIEEQIKSLNDALNLKIEKILTDVGSIQEAAVHGNRKLTLEIKEMTKEIKKINL